MQHKTRRGRRKVACIGAWHPAHVSNTVPKGGQMGYHHRTIKNAKIYAIKDGSDPFSGATQFDRTQKTINPMNGGFRGYGLVRNHCLMIRGSVMGKAKRPIMIKNPCTKARPNVVKEKINIKFIDTSSQTGHGRFQTSVEKKSTMGLLKKDFLAQALSEKKGK